jgi:plastocyanin
MIVCTLLVLSGCGGDDTSVTPSSTTLDLSAVSDGGAPSGNPSTAAVTVGPNNTLSYSPAAVDIAAGGTVNWTWASGNTMPHNVTSGDSPAAFGASATQTSGSFSHTFTNAGTFNYFCTVHGRIMSGVVRVH